MERIDGFESDEKMRYWFLINIYTGGENAKIEVPN